MTQTPEHPTAPSATTTTTPPPDRARSKRLTAVAAWVGIVAGVVFIVAVVFFSGFVLGAHTGGGHGRHGEHHKHESGMSHRGGHQMGQMPSGPRGPFVPDEILTPGRQQPPAPALPSPPRP